MFYIGMLKKMHYAHISFDITSELKFLEEYSSILSSSFGFNTQKIDLGQFIEMHRIVHGKMLNKLKSMPVSRKLAHFHRILRYSIAIERKHATAFF